MNFHAIVVQQRRAARRLLCNCQDTHILTSQWPPCTCDLVAEYHHCFVFRCFFFFFASGAARARSFCSIGVHESQNPQISSAPITKIDGSCSSSSGWRCTTAREAMCALVQDTSAQSLFVFMCRRSETSTWLVQCRRRPEKWTRTRKAGSRGSATPDPVS